ncbi:MAG: hypothetical protein AAB783_01940 [Patescibacteria group bacterium]
MNNTSRNIINWLIAIIALYGISCLVGCGPSIRDRALERHAIWAQHPGTQLEPKGDGVYYVTLQNGEVLQIVVTDSKIASSSCARNCGGKPKEQKKQK